MNIVITWEMRNREGARIDYVLVDEVAFIVRRDSSIKIEANAYLNMDTAHEDAVRWTGQSEKDGYALKGGISVCSVEVDIANIKSLISRNATVKAAGELEKIVAATRIMGKQYL